MKVYFKFTLFFIATSILANAVAECIGYSEVSGSCYPASVAVWSTDPNSEIGTGEGGYIAPYDGLNTFNENPANGTNNGYGPNNYDGPMPAS